MKKASVISIGNEILNGQTIDTNIAYLCSKLFSTGINVVSSYTVGDETDSIVRVLKQASEDADVILVSGGLGPTKDDLTRQGFSKFLGSELQLDEGLLSSIEGFFTERGLEMPATNKVQAYIPAGAAALANNVGTAPGIMAEKGGKLFFAMPGVPAEMKDMFEGSVLPELMKLAGEQAIVIRKLNCFGTGESNIAELLGELMERGRNPQINCTAKYGVITLDIVATAGNKDEAERMAEEDEELLRGRLGDLLYGSGEQTLAKVIGARLTQTGKTIATAESCTGGILAKLLTDVSGASKYFKAGWITYSDESKIRELEVSADLIGRYGSVSEGVAKKMATGALKKGGTDFAIGITGIAGPTGATEQKPVGLVYISLAYKGGCESRRFLFSGGREAVRFRACYSALNMLRLRLIID